MLEVVVLHVVKLQIANVQTSSANKHQLECKTLSKFTVIIKSN